MTPAFPFLSSAVHRTCCGSARRLRAATVAAVITGLLGLLAMPMAPRSAGTGAFGLVVEALSLPVAICTADGIQPRARARDGAPDDGPPATDHGPVCGFCLAHGGFVLVPGRLAPSPPPAAWVAVRPVFGATIVPAAHFLSVYRSRAPPAVV